MESDFFRSELNSNPRVFLWVHPRSLSSAFERSIRELPTVKVLFEPHRQANFMGPERIRDITGWTATDYEPYACDTYQSADEKLLLPYSEYSAVFIKDQAHYVKGKYRNYTRGPFANFKHTFLIRHPHKAIPSHFRACKASGFDLSAVLPQEYGMIELHEMYKTVQEEVDPNPIVIDADDLLMNPKEIMERYCTATGLPFQEKMLTWTPGVVEDWNDTIGQVWHANAMKSSGFIKPTAPEAPPSLESLPKEERDVIQRLMPSYEALHSVRMKLSNV